MIWLLLLSPKFHRAVLQDAGNLVADTVLGHRCAVTGERVFPKNRADHESVNHPGEGACA